MSYNLTNQYIDETFQQLTQVSGSVLLDGTGSRINNLDLTASNAVSSSYAVSASHSEFSDNTTSASYAVSSSHSEFADNATSSSYAANATSSSYAITSSHALQADNATSSSYAVTSSYSVSSSHAEQADNATTASYAVTSSFPLRGFIDVSTNGLQFTFSRGNGTTEQVSAVITGSVENAVSASHAIQADSASTAVSASHAVNADSASFVTGSNVFGPFGSNSIISSSYAISASHADHADLADDAEDLIIGVKNTTAQTILKGQALHATGVTGENIDVVLADCTQTTLMPAVGIAQADINAGAAGRAVVSGRLVGFNTNGYVAGDNVYVGESGSLVQTKPTGSHLIQNIGIIGKVDATDGEMVVLGAGRTNDLPNIAQNYLWLGNSDGVPTAVVSSSIKVDDAISASYAVSSSQAQNANDAISSSYAVTSSHSLTGVSSSYALSASHAELADNLTAGNKTHSGYINQQFSEPGSFGQNNFFTIPYPANMVATNYEYDIVEHAFIDFGAFGKQYENAFAWSYWDSFSYNYGCENLINPLRTQFVLTPPTGSAGEGGVYAIQTSGSGDQFTQALIYGSEVQVGAFRGRRVAIGNRSGVTQRQTQNLVVNAISQSNTLDKWEISTVRGIEVSGGTSGIVNQITNAGLGNNSFVSLDQGNFFELYITGSGTTLAFNSSEATTGYAQTFQILVHNTTNTLSFSSDFKFSGGTAPIITANSTDILTGVYYGESNNNVYITKVGNFF